MQLSEAYPSQAHKDAASTIVDFFTNNYPIEGVLLVNSCTRGKATRDSCLDIAVLVPPELPQPQRSAWENEWEDFNQTNPTIQTLNQVGKYSVVHLYFTDAVFTPPERDEAAGPDDFEVGIGNVLAYSVPLWQKGDYLAKLREQWLPACAGMTKLAHLFF